jgi:hypothetical protein
MAYYECTHQSQHLTVSNFDFNYEVRLEVDVVTVGGHEVYE